MSFTVIRVNWFPGQHTRNAGVLITRVLIKYSTPFLQKWNSSWLWQKRLHSSLLQRGRMHKHNQQSAQAPTSLHSSQTPGQNNVCQLYPGLGADPGHWRSSTQIGSRREQGAIEAGHPPADSSLCGWNLAADKALHRWKYCSCSKLRDQSLRW